MLIKGTNLTPAQRRLVLSAFIYRWTTGNGQRESAWRNASGRPTVAPISDDQWLAEHAFHFVRDGSRLHARRNHCEPHYLAD